MEFEIKKEGNEKYLSIQKLKLKEDDYRIQMLLNNNIKGLLPLRIRNINNEKELLYEITGMSSISSVFERNLMRKDDLVKFAIGIKQLEDTLKEYMLCGDNIKFDLNYIFYKAKDSHYYFCCCPTEVDDYALQIKTLFNQVLDHINYNDREAVSLAYGMQEIASRDDFSTEELLDFALSKREKIEPIIEEKCIEESDYEEFEEEEETKKTLFDKVKEIFFKNKETKKEDEDEYEFEDSINIEEIESNEHYNFETDNLSDEDATVLLTTNAAEYIVLKSINCNPEIMIIPENFPFVIGKSKRSSDFRVSSNVVSRVHARINYELGEFTIEDLNSTNGTFVNDERLRPHEIKTIVKGDIVKLADLKFNVE